jgi:hypothetical protein
MLPYILAFPEARVSAVMRRVLTMPYTNAALGDIYRLIVSYNKEAQFEDVCQNLFDYKVSAIGTPGPAYSALADAWTGVYNALYTAWLSERWVLRGITIHRIQPTQTQARYEQAIDEQGTVSGDAMPGAAAVLVNRHTLDKGPRGNGKFYLSGFSESFNAEGSLTVAGESAVQPFVDQAPLSFTIDGFTFDPVVTHINKTTGLVVSAGLIEKANAILDITFLDSRRTGRGS